VCVFVCLCVCVFVCLCVCVFVCLCVCTLIYTFLLFSSICRSDSTAAMSGNVNDSGTLDFVFTPVSSAPKHIIGGVAGDHEKM